MISRDTYRHVKGLSREQMSKYLFDFYTQAYFECYDDFEAVMFRRLIDDFGFTDEQIKQIKEGMKEDIEAIHLKLISAKEIFDGLEMEGFKNVK